MKSISNLSVLGKVFDSEGNGCVDESLSVTCQVMAYFRAGPVPSISASSGSLCAPERGPRTWPRGQLGRSSEAAPGSGASRHVVVQTALTFWQEAL